MSARRRLRRQRIGTLFVTLATVAAAVAVVVSGSGARAETGSKIAHGTRNMVARGDPKPVPPIQLPRGGRTLLPRHLIVAYYGIVGTSNILGRTSNPEADAVGVQRQARAYRRFGRPVQPAFELVTTIASRSPGTDGTYSAAINR